MAFNDWNDAGSIPTSCAKCHSTPGYIDYLDNGVVEHPAPVGTVVNCEACHNQYTEELTSVVLESTGDTGAVPRLPRSPLPAWAMKRAA